MYNDLCIAIPSHLFPGFLAPKDIPKRPPQAHAQRFLEMRLDAQMQQVGDAPAEMVEILVGKSGGKSPLKDWKKSDDVHGMQR